MNLKAKLASAILVTVSATAAIVYFPWLWTSNKNVESIVEQMNDTIAGQTSREVDTIFKDVNSVQVLIQNSFKQGLIDLNNKGDREAFYLSVLEANPNFTWVQFGFTNGNYVGVQRGQEGRLNVINRVYNANTKQATRTEVPFRRTGDEFVATAQPSSRAEEYVSFERPWYKAAIATPGKQAWTEVYIFATGRVPGIDSSITLENNGQRLGVISIAFDLRQISDFLVQLQGKQPGAIFIVNARGELIASNQSENLTYTPIGKDAAALKPLDQADSPLLQHASRTFKTEQIDFTSSTTQRNLVYTDPDSKARYYISLSELGYLDWMVGTVIPESNYTESIEANKRTLLFAVSGLLGIAAILAVLLTDRTIARPVMNIAKAAADIEAEKFQLNSLDVVSKRSDELGQLARVFQKMAQEVYTREQRLKQTVQELRIEIDEAKRKKQVSDIVETDFFQDLQAKARMIRNRMNTPAAIDALESPVPTPEPSNPELSV